MLGVAVKLTDLNPQWIEIGGRRVGIAFDCPCCVGSKDPGGPLATFFRNPVDGGPPHPILTFAQRYELDMLRDHHIGGTHWQRTGETFDTLTLSPSIDCSAWNHWHGFVRNGEIT